MLPYVLAFGIVVLRSLTAPAMVSWAARLGCLHKEGPGPHAAADCSLRAGPGISQRLPAWRWCSGTRARNPIAHTVGRRSWALDARWVCEAKLGVLQGIRIRKFG